MAGQPEFSFSSYGDVTVHHNGVKYLYNTDAIHHDRWKRMAKYKPMTAWRSIQKFGTLTRRDPPLEEKKPAGPTQLNLF